MKIVGIENSVFGRPQLIMKNKDGGLVFEDLPQGTTRLYVTQIFDIQTTEGESVKYSSASTKLPTTEHADA